MVGVETGVENHSNKDLLLSNSFFLINFEEGERLKKSYPTSFKFIEEIRSTEKEKYLVIHVRGLNGGCVEVGVENRSNKDLLR